MTKTEFEHRGKPFFAEYVNRPLGSFFEIADNEGNYVEGIVPDDRDVSDAIRFFKDRRDQLYEALAVTATAYGLPLQHPADAGTPE